MLCCGETKVNLVMRNKKVIWLLLFLILCLFGGGLSLAISRQSFSFPILPENDSIINRFRLSLKYDDIATKLQKAINGLHQNPSNWKYVKVDMDRLDCNYCCFIYESISSSKDEKVKLTLIIGLFDDEFMAFPSEWEP